MTTSSIERREPLSRELTVRAAILGAFLGVVFGLVTVYVALEVGLNFSASIPIAVLSITVFKRLRRSTILEQNIVQTVGSAGESIAAGVVYTMPALLFLGYTLDLWRIFWLSLIGGILGVLSMVPLREYLIVKEHGTLRYPEGTACADILISGERGGAFARKVFLGLGVGAVYKLAMSGLGLWRSSVEWRVAGLRGADVSLDLAPELVGVGSLIGLPVARVLFAGSVMAGLVFIPLIYFFGEQLTGPIYPSTVPINAMSPGEIWSSYLRYVGAGAVIVGGALLLFQALPTVAASLRGLRTRGAKQDLSPRIVVGGSLLMLAALYILLATQINPHGSANFLSVVLVGVFGFFFVVVSARITGLMGSSANPISGITIAVIMLTCLLFVSSGWVGSAYEIIAVSIGAIVCIAASNAGTTAQDLKTGYLVGASPRAQQIGLIIGVLTSVLVIGFTLTWLNGGQGAPVPVSTTATLPSDSRLVESGRVVAGRAYDVYAVRAASGLPAGRYLVSPDDHRVAYREPQRIGSSQLPAPQAQVMAILVDGLLNHRMRWRLFLVGALVAVMIELAGVRSLPFAVGMYLPLSATSTLLIGACIGRLASPNAADDPFQPGILYSSGLIAGGAMSAIAIALAASFGVSPREPMVSSPLWALAVFTALCALLWRQSRA